jgi:prepilin-type N-terminal cleavage/methylation domain-containing protein
MNTLKNIVREVSQRRGFSLIEVMLAMAMVIIVALGTMSFQYQGVKHSRASEAQIAATRIGQLLLEDWKSQGGDSDYDPNAMGLGFTFVSANNYTITLDYQTFHILLAQQLATVTSGSNPDTVAGVTLQQLSITVTWRKDFGTGAVSGTDPSLVFTTFVRRDV